nr:hypothetical protein [uncultured Draconibacterium sp.]
MSSLNDYTKQVFAFLDKTIPGKKYTIAKLAKQENREKFTNTVKLYMDSFPWQGGITFNHDYSKIYRVELPV